MNISRSEPLWLDLDEVLKAHEAQIAVFGGSPGVRDMALVESALARPRQLFLYDGQTDVLALAVRLGVGLAQNHPFIDGNKRTGTVATIMFLALNGYDLIMPNDERLGHWIEAVIEDRMSEAELADALYPFVEARDL